MKKSIYVLVLNAFLIVPVFLNAQLNHFIYLQTEGKQPFYAKLEKRVLSSSVSGYLIIPKLKEGTYSITIGFPRAENTEQTFVCTIKDKDAGYLIKNFGDKGWGLFNLQTLDVVMAGAMPNEKDLAKTQKNDDFSDMLSDVVNDPSIKQVEKPKEIPKPTPGKSDITKDKLDIKDVVNNPTGITEIVKQENIPQPVERQFQKNIILKTATLTGIKGTEITYIEQNGDLQDTINIFIPFEKEIDTAIPGSATTPVPKKEAPVLTDIEKNTANPAVSLKADESETDNNSMAQQETKASIAGQVVKKQELPGDDKKFLPIELTPSQQKDTLREEVPPAPMINSDCKNFAAEEDFLKLRKKMASADNDDDMIVAALKSFKTKCYSTEQVKNLCVLFLNDAGKYRFFDLAYPYVSDSHNFGLLESLLSEPYYISRFKVMIRH